MLGPFKFGHLFATQGNLRSASFLVHVLCEQYRHSLSYYWKDTRLRPRTGSLVFSDHISIIMMVYARQHLLDISIIQSECIWFFCWKLARSVFFSVFYSTTGGLVIGETTFPINVISETQDLNIQRFGFNVCFTKNTLSWKLFELFWKEKIARHEIFTLWRKNISTVEAKQKNTIIIVLHISPSLSVRNQSKDPITDGVYLNSFKLIKYDPSPPREMQNLKWTDEGKSFHMLHTKSTFFKYSYIFFRK